MAKKAKGTSSHPLTMAKELTNEVNKAWEDETFYEKVSPITQDLLRYWFYPSFCDIREINFHEGQKQAILNIIYLHEVLGVRNVKDLYLNTDPEILQKMEIETLEQDKYQHPMYAVKMATGTGKTWVMHALLIWQYLNASENIEGFSKNFLLVAPGIIVYNRLLDAFLGKENENGVRDFETSDYKKYQDLFIPDAYKDKIFGFLQSSVAKKDEISSKVTGDGLIAITNWHLLQGVEETPEVENPLEDKHQVYKKVFPISPGTQGIDLDTLDNTFIRGSEIEYLAELDDLVVFNDEAHHIHTFKKGGEIYEVEWQKSLNKISESKGVNFIQIDFSATPYSSTGGKNKTKHYFPHVIVDFDLKTAIYHGLVKMIAIDKRETVASIKNLDFKAVREGRKVIDLSEGQRLMLRAGYTKLKILENEFVSFDDSKYPKMLVICEDTQVAPLVSDFFKKEGLNEEDILEIHSNRGEISEKEWESIKQRLFNIDSHKSPKIVVSVLMLREGFDVNNICVIVPLRSTESSILLEQTIGRGLRLMWRGADYEDIKAESRHKLLIEKRAPDNYLDLLSIVEHPNFIKFYEGLDGIVEDTGEITDGGGSVLGDMINVGLRDNYEEYDIYWPSIIQESEEILNNDLLSIENLEVYPTPLADLQKIKGEKGERFKSEEITVRTNFGSYRVSGDIFNAESYNEFLSKIINNVTSMFQNIGRKSKEFPMMQINQAELMGLIDNYVRNRLFDEPFNPMEDENWKILIMSEKSIINHIVKQISICIHKIHTNVDISEAIIEKTYFSSVPELRMRENYSIEVAKSIYERLPYPSNKGGLEHSFIEALDRDSEVEAFTKINEYYHTFATVTYIREDGLLARYFPDFIVKIGDIIYIVETKAYKDKKSPNVQRKRVATLDMLDKINELPPENRMNCEWKYVLLGGNTFKDMLSNNASIKEILEYTIVTESKARGYSTLDNF